MPWKRLARWTIGIILLAAIAGVIGGYVYFGPLRDAQARTYLSDLRKVARPLQARCTTLAQQSEKLLIDNPPDSRAKTEEAVRTLSATTLLLKNDLQQFEPAVNRLSIGPSLPLATTYGNAKIIHDQALDNISQIKETLREYDQLLAFLLSYQTLNQPLNDALTDFNAKTDLNTLAGSSSSLYAIAATIRAQGAKIKNLPAFPGLEPVQSTDVTAHTKAAAGFDALARALSPPIDANIYAAASQIESATNDHEAADTLLAQLLEKLPVLKDVSDLPEKVPEL